MKVKQFNYKTYDPISKTKGSFSICTTGTNPSKKHFDLLKKIGLMIRYIGQKWINK